MRKILSILLFITLAACTQQRESKTITPVNPYIPQNLSYAVSEKVYRYQMDSDPIYPTYSGNDGSNMVFSISPALPTGLQFSSTTGRIAGMPEAVSAAQTYTITATNNSGSTSTDLKLSVIHQEPFGLTYGNDILVTSVNGLINVVPMCSEGFRLGALCTSYSISPALPSFLNFNSTSGRISGIVTSKFTQTYVVTGKNTGGETTFSLTIDVRNYISQLSVGAEHGCAIVDGVVKCWGKNDQGQLGDGSQANKLTPVSVVYSGVGFSTLTAGQDFTCAYRTSDFANFCWGSNADGNLGPNVSSARVLTPFNIGFNLTNLSASTAPSLRRLCGVNDNDEALCFGAYDFGSLVGDNYKVKQNASTILAPVNKVSAGGDFSCFVKSGRVYCHGSNDQGQLGDNLTSGSQSFYTITPTGLESGVTSIDTFGKSACAIKNSAQLFCWGEINGEVTPAEMTVNILDIISLESVSLGKDFLCVKNLGRAYCIGDNSFGQLGQGTTDLNSLNFVEVIKDNDQPLGNILSIEAGEAHVCAIASNEVFCWGKNSVGQLGINSLVNSNKAKKLTF